MDNILNNLYETYHNVIKDLLIGYPISDDSLKVMWDIIHKRHYVEFENDAPKIFNLLEYYEYL